MKRLLFTAMLIALAAALSGCSIIDFDDVPAAGNPILTTFTTDGFTFTSGHFHAVAEPGICYFGGCVDNGTVYINEEAGGVGGPITMARAGGGTFSLAGFDGAQNFLDDTAAANGGFPNANLVVVTRSFGGGGQDTQTFPLDDMGFKTFTFFWGDLASVTFEGRTFAGGPGAIAIDNIQIPVFLSTTAEQAPASLETSVELAPSEAGDPMAAE